MHKKWGVEKTNTDMQVQAYILSILQRNNEKTNQKLKGREKGARMKSRMYCFILLILKPYVLHVNFLNTFLASPTNRKYTETNEQNIYQVSSCG